jgi:hypothetical protein
MKIGVMAPEKSGKTSYLVGLYGTLVHTKNKKPSSEYGLSYEWTDKEQEGFLERQFRVLLRRDIGKQRFPPKTEGIHRHRVKVGHKEDNVFGEIELVDFPGELLRGDSPDKGAPVKAGDVEKALTECAGFVVLLDANYLSAQEGDELEEIEIDVGTAASQIDRVLWQTIGKRAHGSIGVPIALCISKYDRLTYGQRESAYSKAHALFPRFYEMNREHPIFITGVSLGAGIEEEGRFSPLQLESALEFCLAMCAFIERDSQRDRASKEDDRKYEAKRKRWELEEKIQKRKNLGIFGRIGEYLDTGKTASDYQQEADDYSDNEDWHQRQKEEYRSRASEFIRIGEEAARHIRDVDNPGVIYYNGEEHRFKKSIGTGFPLEKVTDL